VLRDQSRSSVRRSPALPRALETPAVIDRREWIDLNLATFEQALPGRVRRIVTEAQTGVDTRAGPSRGS
jgi:hypothetical protein